MREVIVYPYKRISTTLSTGESKKTALQSTRMLKSLDEFLMKIGYFHSFKASTTDYNQFYYYRICVPKNYHGIQNYTMKTIWLIGKVKDTISDIYKKIKSNKNGSILSV